MIVYGVAIDYRPCRSGSRRPWTGWPTVWSTRGSPGRGTGAWNWCNGPDWLENCSSAAGRLNSALRRSSWLCQNKRKKQINKVSHVTRCIIQRSVWRYRLPNAIHFKSSRRERESCCRIHAEALLSFSVAALIDSCSECFFLPRIYRETLKTI